VSKQPLRILVVEDSVADAMLVREYLAEGPGPTHEITHVTRADDAVQHLQTEQAHVILLDLLLPDVMGVEVVTMIRDAAPGSAIVVISGLDDDDVTARALEEGAHHYLRKDDISAESLRRVIEVALDR
jgi:CheY-like chemotaxis protein